MGRHFNVELMEDKSPWPTGDGGSVALMELPHDLEAARRISTISFGPLLLFSTMVVFLYKLS